MEWPALCFQFLKTAERVGRLTPTAMSELDKWSPPPYWRRQNSAYRTALDLLLPEGLL